MTYLVKKSLKGRLILTLLTMAILVQTIGIVTFSNTVATAASTSNGEDLISGTAAYLEQAKGDITDWTAFALSRAGKTVKPAYLDQLEAQIKQKKGKFTSATELERMVLALKAAGLDPQKFAGYNLVQAIYDFNDLAKSGSMGVIFGLLALDSSVYNVPDTANNTQAKLVAWLIEHQEEAKGWSYVAGEPSSIDVTAIALSALSPYYLKNDATTKAVDQALAWLSVQQKPNGGFNDFGVNSESASQVIIALTSLGIDPAGPKFTKTKNVLEALQSYRQADGGYAHAAEARSNVMSTEQALQGLVAYQLYVDKKGAIFNRIKAAADVSLRIEGPQSTLTQGTVRAADAMNALELLCKQNNIPLEIMDSAYGKYIGSIQAIKPEGHDGWLYAVLRDLIWIYPQTGLSDFQLLPNDQLVVYYGGSTQLIHQIKINPPQPKLGQAFTVSVEKSTWDWMLNKEVISSAVGLAVEIGDQKQTTNEQGIAYFNAATESGLATATVTGYILNAAPTVVKSSIAFQIVSDHVNVSITVEGPQKHIAEGVVSAVYTIDALQQFAANANIPIEIKESAYGKYLKAVDGIADSTNDGWVFSILRNQAWVYPDSGIEQFELKANDEIYVYYGFAAQLIQAVTVTPEQPNAGEAIQIAVTQESWDWEKNQRATKPGSGLTIEINGQTYITEQDGTVKIPAGLPNGSYSIIVTGYQSKGSPAILRYEQPLQIYADYHSAAAWAQPFIIKSGKLGLLKGTGIEGFSPAKHVSRAEIAAVLVRLLGLTVPEVKSDVYTDVAATSWYAGYIASVKEQGIVSGTGNGHYAPDQKVTREQLALMLSRALKLIPSNAVVSGFRDAAAAAAKSIPALNAVVEAGLMTGVDDTHFNPSGYVTREMLAAITVRSYDSIH